MVDILNSLIVALESILNGLVGEIDFENISVAGVAGSLESALSGVVQLLIEAVTSIVDGLK
ncbi:MAG: hypothetical protein LBT21_00390 [Oscillospiraceae bacterium]|jgi:hypothetical protein|nr:hypothetical protein [Oscillospiraceae bacterium]